MANIDRKFIVNLQGNEFVTYEGLLDVAHQLKLTKIETQLIQVPNADNGNMCIMKAIAETEDGKHFEGYGDASPANVNKMILPHMIRMAETRAKARALRDLTNIGITAIEELGDGVEPAAKPAPKPATEMPAVLRCADCGVTISQRVADYSEQNFGVMLCYDCQQKYK